MKVALASKLIELQGGELPAEYLTARLQGGLSRIISNWEIVLGSSDPVEYLVEKRYHQGALDDPDLAKRQLNLHLYWLYRQMNLKLRHRFAPLFYLLEYEKLLAVLRLLRNGSAASQIYRLLEDSLLSHKLKEQLQSGKGVKSNLLKKELEKFSHGISELLYMRSDENYQEREAELTDSLLATIFEQNLHPAIRGYLKKKIDYDNLLLLKKMSGWSAAKLPFLVGGEIEQRFLKEAAQNGDEAKRRELSLSFFPRGQELYFPHKLEEFLLDGMEWYLRRLRREHRVTGLILLYIFLIQLEARRAGLIVHSRRLQQPDFLREALL